MQTPAGKMCHYYYEDYNRGANVQECRLIKANPDSERWHPRDCQRCPVPDILNANASPNLELRLTIRKALFGFVRRHEVSASCARHKIAIEDAFVGCPQCNAENPGLEIFRQALEDRDD